MDTRNDSNSPVTADPRGLAGGRDLLDRGGGDAGVPVERAVRRETSGSQSIGGLLKELRDESTTLMRQELALARTEMSEKASKAARNAAYTGVGAALLYLGVFFLLAAVSMALALLFNRWGMDPHGWWIGPLIVGATLGLIGAAVTQKGIATLKRESLVPEKTVQSLQEDKQWLQEKVTK